MQLSYTPNSIHKKHVIARNVNYNVSKIYRKGRVVWKKNVWPLLEPVFGVPKGAKDQKRKDRADANKRKGRRKTNDEYRDDEF